MPVEGLVVMSVRSADQTAIPAVLSGTIVWVIALVAITATAGWTAPSNGIWWWGVTAIGTASGVLGLIFLFWRKSRLRS